MLQFERLHYSKSHLRPLIVGCLVSTYYRQFMIYKLKTASRPDLSDLSQSVHTILNFRISKKNDKENLSNYKLFSHQRLAIELFRLYELDSLQE